MDSTGGRHSGSYVMSGIKTGSIPTQEIFSNIFSCGDRACLHNMREDILPCLKMWNTNMATSCENALQVLYLWLAITQEAWRKY